VAEATTHKDLLQRLKPVSVLQAYVVAEATTHKDFPE
jgi:hypothetical protein